MHHKRETQKVELENFREALGNNFFLKLKQVEGSVMLNHSIFGYFERCRLVNDILSEENYFLRFYERRNKFRYQLRQKLKTKNEIYLHHGEARDFTLIHIVYEPNLDVKKPILCLFRPDICLSFHTSVEKIKKKLKN